MQTLYCISGLGADEGAFKFLDLSFSKPVFISWIKPLKNETMAGYALRLKQQFIHEPNPVIIGLSLGGMVAVEMAKAIPSAKIIIISSAKTKHEIPFYWRFFKHFPLYKVLPEWSFRQHSPMREFFLGAKKGSTITYVKHVAKHADADFYRWAIGAIVNWKNETVPSNIFHIHGKKDNLLPYQFIQANEIINKGGHLMIIENAKEVSALLKQIIA